MGYSSSFSSPHLCNKWGVFISFFVFTSDSCFLSWGTFALLPLDRRFIFILWAHGAMNFTRFLWFVFVGHCQGVFSSRISIILFILIQPVWRLFFYLASPFLPLIFSSSGPRFGKRFSENYICRRICFACLLPHRRMQNKTLKRLKHLVQWALDWWNQKVTFWPPPKKVLLEKKGWSICREEHLANSVAWWTHYALRLCGPLIITSWWVIQHKLNQTDRMIN